MKKNYIRSIGVLMLFGIIGSINVFAIDEIKTIKYEKVEITSNGSIVPMKNSSRINKDALKKEINTQALEIMQKTGNWNYVEPLFPSMTSEGVREVVELYIQKTGNYKQTEAILKYLNENDSNKNVGEVNEVTKQDSECDYEALEDETIKETGDIYSIILYLPHMSKENVDSMVKDYIDKTDDFNCIYVIRQYMSTKGIDDTVKSYIDRVGDYGTVAAMLQFMSVEASDYVANKYIKEVEDQQYLQFFIPYLKGE